MYYMDGQNISSNYRLQPGLGIQARPQHFPISARSFPSGVDRAKQKYMTAHLGFLSSRKDKYTMHNIINYKNINKIMNL